MMLLDQSLNAGSHNNAGGNQAESSYVILRFIVNPNLNFLSRAEVD